MLTVIGPAGAYVVRLVGVGLKRESGRVTILCPPMAVKIAMSKVWDPVKNAVTVLNDHVRVSNHAFAFPDRFNISFSV